MRYRAIVKLVLELCVLLVFLTHVSGAMRLPILSYLENFSYDTRVKLNLDNTMHDEVVIADLDEKSLQAYGHWPWSRHVLAELMDVLFDHYQVGVVGFDMVFSEEDRSSGLAILESLASKELKHNAGFQKQYKKLSQNLKYDEQFGESIKGRNVVVGVFFESNANLQTNTLSGGLEGYDHEIIETMRLPHPQGYVANIPALQKNAKYSGYFDNSSTDEDGLFRRVPLLQEYKHKLYPSLALATAQAYLNDAEISFGLRSLGDGFALQHFKLGEIAIPIDKDANVLVPYQGEAYSFPYYSIADILTKQVNPELLKGRVVLLGTSAAGLLDLRSTPVGKAFPGVEVHANIVSGIINNKVMVLPDYTLGLELVSILLLGFTMMFFQRRLGPGGNIIVLFVLITLMLLLNYYFWQQAYVMPIASELLVLVSLFLLHMSFGYFFEFRGKQVITKQFGQYVPPELVDELADNPQALDLSGQSKELTVLFSDIRGFTEISERLNAKELTDLMNAYLTPMTKVIHEHRGTIDKYMGDAIMAFWGAPLEEAKHARLALDSAMAMLKNLENMNAEFKKRSWPELAIGVGLNTGEMNVGNMGSDFRMAYTVMGDAVNLASRLEGLTKQYGVAMIVSEYLKEAVPEYQYLELDCVRVKGKQEPVKIYQPLGLTKHLAEHQVCFLKRYDEALASYRQQDWQQAKQLFSILEESREGVSQAGHARILAIYIERISNFEKNPPAKDWDGVYVHLSK